LSCGWDAQNRPSMMDGSKLGNPVTCTGTNRNNSSTRVANVACAVDDMISSSMG
jgi:hypothetical protein